MSGWSSKASSVGVQRRHGRRLKARVGAEMHREKSLRIGVHHANGVVWGPVYRTHPTPSARATPTRRPTPSAPASRRGRRRGQDPSRSRRSAPGGSSAPRARAAPRRAQGRSIQSDECRGGVERRQLK
eukprot:30918-Pelagococcus_subviridis.AAC.4